MSWETIAGIILVIVSQFPKTPQWVPWGAILAFGVFLMIDGERIK